MTDIPRINVELYAQTDVGMVRSGNEDNFLVLDLSTGTSWSAGDQIPPDLLNFTQGYYGTLIAVSDGMGGALAGEVASRLAVETVRDRMLQLQAHPHYGTNLSFAERLRLAIEQANDLIHADGLGNPAHKGLGATFTALATQGNQAYFAQVGDSRAYLIRQGKIARITKDQSLVQQLIDAGQITEEEAETHSYRNVILQALGAQNLVNVEINTLPICHLDTFVLCSDGLSGKVQAHEIADIVGNAQDFPMACENMIALANQRGGEDNITVIVVQYTGGSEDQPVNNTIEPQSIARSPDTPSEINWSEGVSTGPLSEPTSQTTELEQAGATAGATTPLRNSSTEPLANPAAPAPPKTTPLTPPTTPLHSRTNDLSDRIGPITSVFDISDFNQETSSEKALQESRPVLLDAALNAVEKNQRLEAAPIPVAQPNKRFSLLPIAAAVLIALVGIGGAVWWYVQQQAKERDQAAQAQELTRQAYETQKQAQLTSLRDKVAELNRKLNAAAKVTQEKRAKLQEKLEKATRQLDEINQLPADNLSKLEKECADVGKNLKEVEDDLNALQGLLRPQASHRDPVIC